jgi:hypothetical protein
MDIVIMRLGGDMIADVKQYVDGAGQQTGAY